MTNQEIFEKAIQKAIDGGWDGDTRDHFDVTVDGINGLNGSIADVSVEELVFNHDFAKALWGEVPCIEYSYKGDSPFTITSSEPLWMWRLQQMVIADDPIKYLGEHLG